MSEPSQNPPFIMMTCQHGAERFLKQEIVDRYHDLRAAFSRPGFVTFKATSDWNIERVGAMRSIFGRFQGLSLGRVACDDVHQAAAKVWEMAANLRVNRIHVFPRDAALPGVNDFEPHIDSECQELHRIVYSYCPPQEKPALAAGADCPLLPAERKELVLDVVPVSPSEWYIAYHVTNDWRSSQPGGLLVLSRPFDSVSRAYLKFEEALRWSGLSVKIGSRWLDIGAAPGGASQALLARGAEVFAVDPAEMSPILTQNPNFTHFRGRLNQIKRRNYRKARWIVTDMNVAPNYTLDVLEDCVRHENMEIRGLLFTLKLVKWELIADIPSYIQRIKSWGFGHVVMGQMQFNRQEIMVATHR